MKKYRVVGIPWHLAHNYELSKLPFLDWSWLIQYRRGYNVSVRGDFMTKWVGAYRKGEFDLAVLHLDQQCLEESILERGKGSNYVQMNEIFDDIPKIVIQHGTPFYPEKFQDDGVEVPKWMRKKGDQKMIEKFVELLGDNWVVFNSETAKYQWTFGMERGQKYYDEGIPYEKCPDPYLNREKAVHIIHGFDPNEWWDLPKEARVVTMISPAGMDAYYDRDLLEKVKGGLLDRGIHHCHITVDWIAKNWDEYRDFMGRSMIYFNPTFESPMPRSRTEAFLSGSCVISTVGQDVEKYIVQGENGFLIPKHCDPKVVVDLIMRLYEKPEICLEVGQKGKKMAIERFSLDRYHSEWKDLVERVMKSS